MARQEATRTHLENLAIIPNTSHGDAGGDQAFAIYGIDSDPNNPGTPAYSISEDGVVTVGATNPSAGGDAAGDFQVTQGAVALTGTLRAIYGVATNGTVTATGTIRGGEFKARAADPSQVGATSAMLEGVLISVDAKTKTATGMRGLHVTLDGGAGGTSTLVQGVLINNNSSAVQTTSYAIDINEGGGLAAGHKLFTKDIRLQYGATIDNATDGVLNLTATTVRATGALDVTGATTTAGTIDTTITNTAAGGDKGLNLSITQSATALTGNLIGAAITATNGTSAATSDNAIRGVEVKARAATPANSGHTVLLLNAGYFSADAKNKTATTMRGVEISLDGGAGGTSTLAVGLVINNNSSATQTTSYGIALNDGEGSGGHKLFTADIQLQNGETIDNATNGTINLTATTIKATGILDVTGNSTLDSVDVGGGSSGGSGVTIATTGITTATVANATTNTTVRAIHGKVTASGTGMTASYLATGVRGEVVMSGTATGQAYFYGTQGKLTPGTCVMDGGMFAAALVGQMDLTGAMTITSVGCLSGLWVDAGATAHANAITGQAQINMVQINQTCPGLVVNSAIKVQAYATYLIDARDGGGSTGNFSGGAGTDCANTFKVYTGGAVGYLRVFAAP